MDKNLFLCLMAILQKYFNIPLTDDTIEIYYQMLKDKEPEFFKRSCYYLIKTYVPTNIKAFPLIPHFDEAIEKVRIKHKNTYDGFVSYCEFIETPGEIEFFNKIFKPIVKQITGKHKAGDKIVEGK